MDVQKIITSADLAELYGSKTSRDWYIQYSLMLKAKKVSKCCFIGDTDETAEPAIAYIDYSRWVAGCTSCKRINYVDPLWQYFYCFGCGNNGTGLAVRAIFPDNWHEIENALLCRPVINLNKSPKNLLDNALNSKPILGLKHNWNGEALADLIKDNIEKGIT
jgi:hypothetical protein